MTRPARSGFSQNLEILVVKVSHFIHLFLKKKKNNIIVQTLRFVTSHKIYSFIQQLFINLHLGCLRSGLLSLFLIPYEWNRNIQLKGEIVWEVLGRNQGFLSQSLNLQDFSKSSKGLAVLLFRNVRGSQFEPHSTNTSFMSPFVSSIGNTYKSALNLAILIWATAFSELCREIGKMLLKNSKRTTDLYYNHF